MIRLKSIRRLYFDPNAQIELIDGAEALPLPSSSDLCYNLASVQGLACWREMMYRAATRLSPEDLRDAARFAFLEMALNGITAVGEFHYLHRTAEGQPYDDPNLLSKAVIDAANEIGLRIALLRVAYARSGHLTEPN